MKRFKIDRQKFYHDGPGLLFQSSVSENIPEARGNRNPYDYLGDIYNDGDEMDNSVDSADSVDEHIFFTICYQKNLNQNCYELFQLYRQKADDGKCIMEDRVASNLLSWNKSKLERTKRKLRESNVISVTYNSLLGCQEIVLNDIQ